ncbi:MAG: twin-arginine translocase TatA/TatE family subunit [Actinomycetota bacterium]|nr:twin-arginine translocase TatA/TatE family subunit [Actinomycetota bacterium]
MPGSIGWQGFLIVAVLLLLFFGPKRLPEMGRSVGRGMREFKDSVTGSDDAPAEISAQDTPTVAPAPAHDRVGR